VQACGTSGRAYSVTAGSRSLLDDTFVYYVKALAERVIAYPGFTYGSRLSRLMRRELGRYGG
jgi:hypothetical protein